MRLLICGDRNWANYDSILSRLRAVKDQIDVVIEGGAKGADTDARAAAEELQIPVIEFVADWAKYGRAAGPIRNQQMLTVGKPDLVWAFHQNIEQSRGTANMIAQALKHGIPVAKFTS